MNRPGEQFNINIGGALTWNVQPILHEIRHALDRLLGSGETSIIDLRSIPLAPGEETTIIDTLGQGEVHARLDALGLSEIYETGYSGVWLVTHFNEDDSVISRFIEITHIPDILRSQDSDVAGAVDRLRRELETNNAEPHAENDT